MLNSSYSQVFKGWTCFCFNKKLVYISDGNFTGTIANIEQHKFFVKYFVNNGKETCSFREFREVLKSELIKTPQYKLINFIDFDHRRHESIKYGTIELNRHSFSQLFRFMENPLDDTFERSLSKMIDTLRLKDKKLDDKFLEGSKKDKIITLLASFSQFVKEMDF